MVIVIVIYHESMFFVIDVRLWEMNFGELDGFFGDVVVCDYFELIVVWK